MGKRVRARPRPRRVPQLPSYQEASHLRFHADKGSDLWKLRDEAHRAFDVHWEFYDTSKQRRRARTQAYKWLARKLGIPEDECHFGMFGERQCRQAIKLCRSEAPPPCEP